MQSFSRWQWVTRKVYRSSSVTRTINISRRLGFSLRRLEATMWCSVCITTASKQGKAKVAPSYLSSKIMFPENFYTITRHSEASNWVLQFLHPRQCKSAVPSNSNTNTHIHTTDQWASSLVWLSLTEASTLLPPNFGQEDNRIHRSKGICEAVHRSGQMAEGAGVS